MSRSNLTTAMILAGGVGSRLRSVVSDRPKVLAAIYGRPFLAYLLDALQDAGLSEVVFCTGYMAETVEETFGARPSASCDLPTRVNPRRWEPAGRFAPRSGSFMRRPCW